MEHITYISHQSYLFKGTVGRQPAAWPPPQATEEQLWAGAGAGEAGGLPAAGSRGCDTPLLEQGLQLVGRAVPAAGFGPGRCSTTARCTFSTRPPPTSTWRARTTSWREIRALAKTKTVLPDLPPAGQRGGRRIASTCWTKARWPSSGTHQELLRAGRRLPPPVGRPSEPWNTTGKEAMPMKKRSGFQVMAAAGGPGAAPGGLYGCWPFCMGLVGHLCAAFLTVLGGYALAGRAGAGDSLLRWGCCLAGVAGVRAGRGASCAMGSRPATTSSRFKLLALLRDKVFQALRRLCPAKLEGTGQGQPHRPYHLGHRAAGGLLRPHPLPHCHCGAVHGGAVPVHWQLPLGLGAAGFGGLRCGGGGGAIGDFPAQRRRRPAVPAALGGAFQLCAGQPARAYRRRCSTARASDRLEEMDARTAALSPGRGADEAHRRPQPASVTDAVILVFDVAMLFAARGAVPGRAGGLSGGTAAHAGADELLWTLCGAGQPREHLAEHLRRGEPGAGHFGGGARWWRKSRARQASRFTGAAAEQVAFAYGEERILDGVSVEVPKGSVVGIVGRSGSGKSTLLKLFMRFWEAQQGQVRVSGRDVKDIEHRQPARTWRALSPRRHTCSTTASGPTCASPSWTPPTRRSTRACRKASVHQFIDEPAPGLRHPGGRAGQTPSPAASASGWAWRGPSSTRRPSCLLDEPTSNLDSLNEAVILQLSGGGTGGKDGAAGLPPAVHHARGRHGLQRGQREDELMNHTAQAAARGGEMVSQMIALYC